MQVSKEKARNEVFLGVERIKELKERIGKAAMAKEDKGAAVQPSTKISAKKSPLVYRSRSARQNDLEDEE